MTQELEEVDRQQSGAFLSFISTTLVSLLINWYPGAMLPKPHLLF